MGLVIKTNKPQQNEYEGYMKNLIADFDDRRIILIEGLIPRDEILSLIYVCNCCLSLHRSEGFGMGMAESLALNRPVVATNYSSSTDFITEANGYSVQYQFIPVKNNFYFLGENQLWADPDHAHAVIQIRNAFNDNHSPASKFDFDNIFNCDLIFKLITSRIDNIIEKL